MHAKRVNIVSLKMIKDKSFLFKTRVIKSPSDMYNLTKEFLENADRESFIVVCLNTKNEPINVSTVSTGTLNSSLIHPREVFKVAVLSNANSIICAHNHPSGSIAPSKEDKGITYKIKESGEILGIKLLDHIIVGNDNFYSFKQNNIL